MGLSAIDGVVHGVLLYMLLSSLTIKYIYYIELHTCRFLVQSISIQFPLFEKCHDIVLSVAHTRYVTPAEMIRRRMSRRKIDLVSLDYYIYLILLIRVSKNRYRSLSTSRVISIKTLKLFNCHSAIHYVGTYILYQLHIFLKFHTISHVKYFAFSSTRSIDICIMCMVRIIDNIRILWASYFKSILHPFNIISIIQVESTFALRVNPKCMYFIYIIIFN